MPPSDAMILYKTFQKLGTTPGIGRNSKLTKIDGSETQNRK